MPCFSVHFIMHCWCVTTPSSKFAGCTLHVLHVLDIKFMDRIGLSIAVSRLISQLLKVVNSNCAQQPQNLDHLAQCADGHCLVEL